MKTILLFIAFGETTALVEAQKAALEKEQAPCRVCLRNGSVPSTIEQCDGVAGLGAEEFKTAFFKAKGTHVEVFEVSTDASKAPKTETPAPAGPTVVPAPPAGGDEPEVPVAEMSKPELQAEAEKRGLAFKKNDTVATLRELLGE